MKNIPIQENIVQQNTVERFITLLRQQRLAHAYLFVGPMGVGKRETARCIAQMVHCGKNALPCGQCSASLRVASGNHPDALVIDSGEDDSIKIIKVRELIQRTQLKPFESQKKIFIIHDVEKMTLEGSNALLKTLEEPSVDTLMILTTAFPENVLATVKSRCHVIQFVPASQQQLSSLLAQRCELSPESSQVIGYFAQGCLGRALNLHQTKFLQRKNEIIDQVVLRKDNETYLKTVLSDKTKIKEMLTVLLYWFRDVLLLKVRVDENYMTHLDRKAELVKLASRYSFEQLNTIIVTIMNALSLLEENLNVKIALTLLREKIWARS